MAVWPNQILAPLMDRYRDDARKAHQDYAAGRITKEERNRILIVYYSYYERS